MKTEHQIKIEILQDENLNDLTMTFSFDWTAPEATKAKREACEQKAGRRIINGLTA